MDKPSADSLVTEPSIPAGATQIHPAAHLDPAAAFDPAKVKPAPAKPAKKKRRSFARRVAADAASKRAEDAKTAAADNHAAAKQEHDRAQNDELRIAYEAAVHNEVDRFADLPDGDLAVRLAGHGHFVSGNVAASRADFVPAGFGITYTKAIDIGPGGDPVRVDEAWLIAASGEAVRCAVGPLAGGGGYHAQIPASSLRF